MSRALKSLMIAPAILLLAACASQSKTETQVEAEAQAQPQRPMHGGVALKGIEAIDASTTLKPDQKKKLSDLHAKMISDTFAIQEETSKLKGVLFETLTAQPYDKSKVEVIKKKLSKLNTQKMDNMFKALKEAETILEYVPANERSRIYKTMFHESMMSTGREI